MFNIKYNKLNKLRILNGWNNIQSLHLSEIYDFKYGEGNNIPENTGTYPIYGGGGICGYYDKFNSEDSPVIGHIGAYAGLVQWAKGKHFVTYNGVICTHKNKLINKRYAFYLLLKQDFIAKQKGSQPFISYDILNKPEVNFPPLEIQEEIVNILDKFEEYINSIESGLKGEIEARHQQYEYYRDKLLTFDRKEV